MKLFAIAYVGLLTGCAAAMEPAVELTDAKRPVEIGQVNWLRNLDEAKLLAAKTDKPILLLFQEIPG